MPRGCVDRELAPGTAEVTESTYSSATARAEEEERKPVLKAAGVVKYYRRCNIKST
jgi:hypothetical protein